MRAAALLILGAASLLADVKPSALFSEHMVLQSAMAVPVWGTASPGEPVTVTLNGQKRSTKASADGKWMVRLKKLKPGGPFRMTIAGNNTVTVNDVLVGEVWLGSGQSNMAFTVSKKRASYAGLVNEEREIAEANYPLIRMFTKRPRPTSPKRKSRASGWSAVRKTCRGSRRWATSFRATCSARSKNPWASSLWRSVRALPSPGFAGRPSAPIHS